MAKQESSLQPPEVQPVIEPVIDGQSSLSPEMKEILQIVEQRKQEARLKEYLEKRKELDEAYQIGIAYLGRLPPLDQNQPPGPWARIPFEVTELCYVKPKQSEPVNAKENQS